MHPGKGKAHRQKSDRDCLPRVGEKQVEQDNFEPVKLLHRSGGMKHYPVETHTVPNTSLKPQCQLWTEGWRRHGEDPPVNKGTTLE
jgi:hypothetical protein